jgi:hypothetical protein
MMKRFFAVVLMGVCAAGCQGKPDNSAVRYGTSLSEDTVKARANAAKANEAVAAEAARLEEAAKQSQ